MDRGLQAHHARPAGKTGPGAGRPAKLYEPSGVEMGVSIPERRYGLVGSILVEAIESRSPEESAKAVTRRVAREAGEVLGREVRRTARLRPAGRERALSMSRDVLHQHGFEPCESTAGEQGQPSVRRKERRSDK